jgi:hypothetical protein
MYANLMVMLDGSTGRDEGRFLGESPPYGYLIADVGPHPNPAGAADGVRIHELDIDPGPHPRSGRSSASS